MNVSPTLSSSQLSQPACGSLLQAQSSPQRTEVIKGTNLCLVFMKLHLLSVILGYKYGVQAMI